mmetsp:Transcript_682/g.1376  ORF Transcript_682/g.1376 Transcript_682/m.1376 type:complete len:86 (+) Transcript_682:1760-2017(+)
MCDVHLEHQTQLMEARTNDLKSYMTMESTNALLARKERVQKRVHELISAIQENEIELFELESQICDLKEEGCDTPKGKRRCNYFS